LDVIARLSRTYRWQLLKSTRAGSFASITTQENDSSYVLCHLYCSFSHIDLRNVRRLWERIGNSSNPPKILFKSFAYD